MIIKPKAIKLFRKSELKAATAEMTIALLIVNSRSKDTVEFTYDTKEEAEKKYASLVKSVRKAAIEDKIVLSLKDSKIIVSK